MAEPAIPIDDPNRELPRRSAVSPEAPRHARVLAGPEIEPRSNPRLVVASELDSRNNSRLNGTAETIGSAVGSAVVGVRHLPERLQDMKERFTVIRGRAQAQAATRVTELKQSAQQQARVARNRAAYYAHDYPLHVIAGVAGAGFILGIAIRIWRSTRA